MPSPRSSWCETLIRFSPAAPGRRRADSIPDDFRRTNDFRAPNRLLDPDDFRRANEFQAMTNDFHDPDDFRRTNDFQAMTNEFRDPDDFRRANDFRAEVGA